MLVCLSTAKSHAANVQAQTDLAGCSGTDLTSAAIHPTDARVQNATPPYASPAYPRTVECHTEADHRPLISGSVESG